ncbi:MAG: hypothetical protein QXK52_06090 [Candidatus Bathyarchaeia archaeon]
MEFKTGPRLGAKLTGVIGFLHAWDWMSRKHPQLEVRAMLVVLGPIDAECRGLLAEMFSPPAQVRIRMVPASPGGMGWEVARGIADDIAKSAEG